MKLKLTLLLAIILSSFSVNAQTKLGTVDSEYILSLMPELETVTIRMKSYGAKLDSTFNIKVKEYDAKVDAYNKAEKTLSAAEKKTKYDELVALDQDLNKFRQNGATLMELRKDDLYKPLYNKMAEVIDVVAKENGYTQILTVSGNQFAYIDVKFDITDLVLKKLGIAIPKEK